MKVFRKTIILKLVAIFLLSSCVYDYTAEFEIDKYTDDEPLAKVNSSRLLRLEPGMSKSQVLEAMGTINGDNINNPYLVSLFSIKEDNITIIYYFTKNPYNEYKVYKVTFENLTPLVLLNGKLIGWGEEALRRAQDKYDFTIKKDFNIKVD